MKKRILSIVLAVLMLVGIMPISAIAADAEPPAAQTGVSTKTSENTTGPKLEKSAQWVDEKAGIAMITIKVTGEQPTETTKKTDIVLVIDRSLSMTQNDRDWLKNAKQAAKAFAKKVLTGDPNVRIAVVAYAAKTINDWNFSSKLETVENNIDAINTNNGNWHGTNIQAGIHSARERFKSTGNKDADKFMIVLADGAPNCRFGIYSASETWRLTSKQAADYHIKTDYREGGKQYFPNLYTANSTTFSYNNSDIMDEDSGYCYTATVSEAYAAKATDGITCYAIGYGIASGSSLINTLMYSISSTDAGFVNAGTDVNAITKVFSDIATDIQYKAHDVTLTDTMGAGFTYLANETYPSNPVVTPSAGNKTVTWDVADKLGDETKTLTFYVQYDKQNLTEAETLPTNTSASLSYKDNKGNAQPNITVASPEIENLAFTVTYLDETGEELTDAPYTKTHYWHGDKVAIAAGPAKDGYTFNGWTTDDVTIGENDTFEMPKQNVTLKASWTKNTKTLTITKNWKGTTETPAVTFQLLQARKGENAAVYQTFKLDGVVDTGSEVVETAPWTATIEVPVKDTDGTEFKYSVKETKIGGTSTGAGAFNVTGTNPDNTPYIIGTWSVNSSGRPLEGTWTFTNKYTPKTPHTLTYQFVGENKPAVELPAAETLYENQQTDLAVVVAPDGWSFDGWYTDAGCTEGNKVTSPYTMPGSNMTLYGKWEQKQPGVSVEKTAKRTRGNESPVTLPNNTNDPNEIGRVQVGDVINYTVTIKNTGKVTFGNNINDYRFTDTFSNATGDLIQIDEDGKQIWKVESGKRPPNISLGDMKPGDTKTLYYRYMVLLGDVGQQINNSATAEIKSGTGAGKIQKSSNVRVLVEKPEPETATLRFEFVNGTDNTTLPEDVTNQCPAERLVEKNTSVTLETVFDDVEDNNSTWTFVGWYTDAGCTAAVADPYVMPDTDTTLYGKWTYQAPQPETTTITVKKEWRGLADGATKPEVKMTLWQSTAPDFKELIENAGTLTLNGSTETTPWTGVFENVPLKNDEDEPLYYFVSETEIGGIDVPFTRTESVDVTRENEDGSITVIGTWHISREKNPATNTWTITNRYEDKTPAPVEKISITVEKRWDKNNSESVVKPNEISVQLTQNGVNYGKPVELSAANNWTYTFTELLETDDNGEAYNYSVKEPDLDARDGNGDVIGTWKPLIVQTDTTITITNTFVAKEPEPELEDHEFTAHIVKRFENKSGKSPKATFTFVAALDDGTNVGRATISFSKGEVDAGDFERKDETMTVKLTDSQYEALEKDRIGRYLWIYEEDGEVDGVKYDTKPQKAYIYEKPVAWSLEFDEDGELVFSVPDENTLYCLVGDEMVEDFVFTNTYKKPGKVEKPVKVGPQLNRDDHVAYIMGYPDGRVRPEGEITRAEACTIFFRLLTESSRDYYFSKVNDYTDVARGDWFNNAISTLSNAGIVTGYNDGTFRPNQPITRGEMAKIIANFANLSKGGKTFSDLSGHWSKTYVELAAGNGWIAGYPDGSFRPDQKITRAETVTMINRVLERVPAKELRLLSRSIMLTFPDNNPGDWYYIAIQEASNSHEYQRSVYETTGDEMWTKLIDNVDWTKLEK